MTPPLFSAVDIATLLTAPGETPLIPTVEQQAIIETAPEHAVLVIAGAGSGKTETLANRLIWLVANGWVRPNEVLGLTFTRKAAGELAERMRGRLVTFIERASNASLTAGQSQRIAELHEALTTTLDLPEVSTYNAFAAALVQEFGSATGIGGQLIDEAVAWGIARQAVVESTDSRLASLGVSIERLTELTLTMAHAVTDHLSTFDAARQAIADFEGVRALPYDEKALAAAVTGTKVYADITKQIADFEKSLAVIDLAEAYVSLKRDRGVLEFADQIALARTSLRLTPESIGQLRARYRVVLLDEVQDTSVAQTTLLSEIFRGKHVMAVGDPHQSIYGWRGASSVSLTGFHDAFSHPHSTQQHTLTLSTSWRNARAILEVANRAALPLRDSTAISVPVLRPRPGAPAGDVTATYVETLAEEAHAVAEWMREQRESHAFAHDGSLPTTAVIFRKRKYMSLFADALSDAGIPARIVGVGGLLSTPEVRELVSLLRSVWYADASNDLIRVLASPRFAIAPADIVGLRHVARWFAKRDYGHQRIDESEYATGILESLDREVSLIDALDLLPQLQPDHRALATISAEGQLRMREASAMLRRLRTLIAGDVIDLIRVATQELRIDIELESHERYTETSSATARENLYALAEAVRGFLQVSTDRSLRAVLEWLEHSEREDELPAHIPPPEPGTVQLITVHSAKGLEWDYVAIPRQSLNDFPSAPKSTRGEFSAGTIPDACRGDAISRPVCAWRDAETQKEVLDAITQYKDAQAALLHEEELRLIYVAYTRAKRALLLTGSFWGTAQRSSPPSAPLRALAADYTERYALAAQASREPAGLESPLIGDLPEQSTHDEKPEAHSSQTLTWPLDPLGTRRDRVQAAASAVRDAPKQVVPNPEALLLMADEAALHDSENAQSLFTRVNASSFHDVVRDPHAARRNALRPVPQRPFRRTRIGNLFHDWVERRTTTAMGTSLTLGIDGLDDANVTDAERAELETLIEIFENSRWATLQPIMVERQITFPFAGRRAVCKIDAVYEIDGRIEIVDWKTGRSPQTDDEREDRFLQLDLYRVAYALETGTALEHIDVTLYYVEENTELRSREARTVEQLEAIWNEAFASL